MFTRLTAAGLAWDDGTEEPVDTVIWCTGFRPALQHLAKAWPGLGDLPGAGRSARDTAADISDYLARTCPDLPWRDLDVVECRDGRAREPCQRVSRSGAPSTAPAVSGQQHGRSEATVSMRRRSSNAR